MAAHKKTYEKDTRSALSPKNTILLETAPLKKKMEKNHHGTPILDPNVARVSTIPPLPHLWSQQVIGQDQFVKLRVTLQRLTHRSSFMGSPRCPRFVSRGCCSTKEA